MPTTPKAKADATVEGLTRKVERLEQQLAGAQAELDAAKEAAAGASDEIPRPGPDTGENTVAEAGAAEGTGDANNT